MKFSFSSNFLSQFFNKFLKTDFVFGKFPSLTKIHPREICPHENSSSRKFIIAKIDIVIPIYPLILIVLRGSRPYREIGNFSFLLLLLLLLLFFYCSYCCYCCYLNPRKRRQPNAKVGGDTYTYQVNNLDYFQNYEFMICACTNYSCAKPPRSNTGRIHTPCATTQASTDRNKTADDMHGNKGV